MKSKHQHSFSKRELDLIWQQNLRDGKYHWEWTAHCGCAYHPEPYPHIHPCNLHSSSCEVIKK